MPRISNTRTGISDMVRTAQEGEIKRAAHLKVTAEARFLRHEELARLHKQEEGDDTTDPSYPKDHNGSQVPSSRCSSRHSSIEPSHLTGSSYGSDPLEMKRLLIQLNERYKDVLVINAQLDCEKQFLAYSVDLLKDKLEEATELNQYNQKSAADRKRDLAYQKMQLLEVNRQLGIAQQQISIRDNLIMERGFVLVNVENDHPSDNLPNGDANNFTTQSDGGQRGSLVDQTVPPSSTPSSFTILSKYNAEALKSIGGVDIDSKLTALLAERAEDKERIEKLKLHLAEERERVELAPKLDSRNKVCDHENLRQAVQTSRSQAQDYKFRLEQANQKITGLEGDIIRLEGQVKRFKTVAENAEQQEDELKHERRKIQRELREALSVIDDLKSENSTLQRKLDKLSKGAGATTVINNLRSYRDSSQSR